MHLWKCMVCDEQTSFKGLCRNCTEYDSSGKVLNPIRRVKVNSLGFPIIKKKGINNTNLNKGFRESKKLDVHKTLVEDMDNLLIEDDGFIDLA